MNALVVLLPMGCLYFSAEGAMNALVVLLPMACL